MTVTEPSAPVSMIDRVVGILDTFNGPASLTVAQVAARTGVPRSSAHRILEHLVKIRWLDRDGGTYRLGLGVLELGGLAAHQNQLRTVALPYLHELAGATGMIVHLAVLDGPEIVYLEKIGGSFGMRLPSRVGGRQPAYCTAVGKTLLAYADDHARRASLSAAPRGRTSRSITTDHRLQQELGRVRDRGVAFDREEAVAGIGCVASPVGPPRSPAAAISICGPVADVQFDRLIVPVRLAASQIWNSLASDGRHRVTSAVPALLAR